MGRTAGEEGVSVVDMTRRRLLVSSAAAGFSVVTGAAFAPRAAAGQRIAVSAFGVTPDRAAVVAHLADGQLWASQDGSVAIQHAADGIVVVGLPVKRSARSDIRISVAGQDDVSVSVDTRPEALRTSLLRVVNKRIALDAKDEPAKVKAVHGVMVDERLGKPLDAMFARAKKDGIGLEAISAHRPFEYQRKLYDEYKKRDGEKAADTYSARPGHSEHQLGLALDVRGADGKDELEPAFKNTPTGRWVAAHAHEFGFVVRYPDGQKAVTGYEPEPWHLRYVGADVARYLHARHDIATLEALFGLPDAPGY